jgi:hypothetical protein
LTNSSALDEALEQSWAKVRELSGINFDDPDEYVPITREQMERAAENVARFMGVAGEQAQ